MKKIALTSLLAVFAVSGAHAANVIDGNPLYMPKAGHFYSVTELESHTKNDTPWKLNEEFGYGVLDNLSVNVATSLAENKAFDEYAWEDVSFALTFRALDMDGWKLDVLAAYDVDGIYNHPRIGDHDAWLDKEDTMYTWAVGVRGGYVASNWTIAGKALFEYQNTESFNWNEGEGKQGVHALTLGVDGQYVVCDRLSLVAGVEYTGIMDKEWYGTPGVKVKNAGTWEGEFGINYNIDATKFVGAYINGSLNHEEGDNHDEWGWDKGFGYGIRFGVDF